MAKNSNLRNSKKYFIAKPNSISEVVIYWKQRKSHRVFFSEILQITSRCYFIRIPEITPRSYSIEILESVLWVGKIGKSDNKTQKRLLNQPQFLKSLFIVYWKQRKSHRVVIFLEILQITSRCYFIRIPEITPRCYSIEILEITLRCYFTEITLWKYFLNYSRNIYWKQRKSHRVVIFSEILQITSRCYFFGNTPNHIALLFH